MNKQDWLATYFYYGEPLEPFLREFIVPLANDVKEVEGITQYFFIRYWERGPHIRLRFKGMANILYGDIEKKIKDAFKVYLNKYPSKRNKLYEMSDSETQPNNSLIFAKYYPEVNRYGGQQAIKVAEKHFQHSSQIVLNLLSKSKNWDYNQAMGEAIKLHLSFVYALGMEIEEAEKFFDYIFEEWFSQATSIDWSQLEKIEQEKLKNKILNSFQRAFKNQEKTIVPFCRKFWKSLDQKTSESLKEWITSLNQTRKRIINIQQNGNLYTPPEFQINNSLKIPPENQERWRIYQSYVHMTNNRLGIYNRDEAFLGFLLKKSFEQILKSLAKRN